MEEVVTSPNDDFDRLVELVETLRSDHGCPWDREQTPEQVKVYLIEEAYEVLEAIESGRSEAVCGELGDLLFQVVFLAKVFEETGDFNIGEVLQGITQKMIRRHPHVFGTIEVSCADEVRDQWHKIKMTEAKENSQANPSSYLDSVPKKLPALMRAYRLGERAARVGFDYPDIKDLFTEAGKKLEKFRVVVERSDTEKSAEVFGDLMFLMVTLARFAGLHPETALTQAVMKFVKRFRSLEQTLADQGLSLESVSFEEIEDIVRRKDH